MPTTFNPRLLPHPHLHPNQTSWHGSNFTSVTHLEDSSRSLPFFFSHFFLLSISVTNPFIPFRKDAICWRSSQNYSPVPQTLSSWKLVAAMAAQLFLFYGSFFTFFFSFLSVSRSGYLYLLFIGSRLILWLDSAQIMLKIEIPSELILRHFSVCLWIKNYVVNFTSNFFLE